MADGLQALLLYHSVTGNTEKVAQALQQGLEDEGCRVTVRRVEQGVPDELLDYDLVCLGTPGYQFLPTRPARAAGWATFGGDQMRRICIRFVRMLASWPGPWSTNSGPCDSASLKGIEV